jgi:hypothetical protein
MTKSVRAFILGVGLVAYGAAAWTALYAWVIFDWLFVQHMCDFGCPESRSSDIVFWILAGGFIVLAGVGIWWVSRGPWSRDDGGSR